MIFYECNEVLDDNIMLVIIIYSYKYFMLKYDELCSYEEILDAWNREEEFSLINHMNVYMIIFYE